MGIASEASYREIISAFIHKNANVKGYKSKLAKAASCQLSYLSQILRGQVHLTLDQAASLCQFWAMDKIEADYFVTLVNYERAATPVLRKLLKERLLEIRLSAYGAPPVEIAGPTIPQDLALKYFSNWQASAVHRAIDIPSLRTVASLSRHFALSEDTIHSILVSLESMKLVSKEGDYWVSRNEGFTLNTNKELMEIYHASMRNKAISSLNREGIFDFHFSAVYAVSDEDYVKVRSLIKEIVVKSSDVAYRSKAEALVGICIDLFTF